MQEESSLLHIDRNEINERIANRLKVMSYGYMDNAELGQLSRMKSLPGAITKSVEKRETVHVNPGSHKSLKC